MNAKAKMNSDTYDVAALRRDFPILARKVHGKPLVYLDNAASAQKPKPVLDAMRDFTTSEYANVHRGVHYLSGAATERYEEARRRVQRFLNAAREDEIVFTKGGTEAINLVAASFLAPRIEPGDEIVLSIMEHHSNIVPWHFLRERQGAVLKWVEVSDSGELDPADVARAITPRTKLVAISHMTNVLGTKTALGEIVRLAPDDPEPATGLLKDFSYTRHRCEFSPGDLFIGYTDGVLEAADASGNMFGEEGVRAVLVASTDLGGFDLADRLLREVQSYSGRTVFEDDVCLVAIEAIRL